MRDEHPGGHRARRHATRRLHGLCREGVTLIASDSDQDDFVHNRVTLLGEPVRARELTAVSVRGRGLAA